jgi:hypothetical protein
MYVGRKIINSRSLNCVYSEELRVDNDNVSFTNLLCNFLLIHSIQPTKGTEEAKNI